MSHPRWPGFETKTGNPVVDNYNRRVNLNMWRDAQSTLKFTTGGGRRRKKKLTRVEGGNYLKLLASVMNDLIRRDRAAVSPPQKGNSDE